MKRIDRRMVEPDLFLEIAKGNVEGYKLITTPGFHATDVEITQLGDLSLIPGVVVYPAPTSEMTMQASSGSTEDSLLGSGIKTLEVHYLDGNYIERDTTVTMQGTMGTTIATDIYRVQQMHGVSVGSNTVGVGNIDLKDGGATIYERIGAGGNQSLSARYTVPQNHTAFIKSWHCSGTKKRITFYLRATVDRETRIVRPGVFHFQDFELCELSNSGPIDVPYLRCPQRSEIKISCQAELTGGEAGGAFTILQIAH